jgi:hypothetical protein
MVQTFLLSVLPYTTIIAPLVLSLVLRPLSFNNLNYLPSGPTAIIFSVLAQYHATIPHTFKYRISTSGGSTGRRNPNAANSSDNNNNNNNNQVQNSKPSLTILLSDKSTTYLVAAQLALSQFPASLLPAITGWAVGVAWRADLLPVSRGIARGWRIPAWIVGEKEPVRRSSPAGASATAAATGGAGGSGEDSEQYENLRRRLDAASAAAAAQQAAGSSVAGESEQRQRRPLLERFTNAF